MSNETVLRSTLMKVSVQGSTKKIPGDERKCEGLTSSCSVCVCVCVCVSVSVSVSVSVHACICMCVKSTTEINYITYIQISLRCI